MRGGVVGTVTWEGPSEWSHMVDDAGSVRAATLGKRILAGAFDWGVMWGASGVIFVSIFVVIVSRAARCRLTVRRRELRRATSDGSLRRHRGRVSRHHGTRQRSDVREDSSTH